jgi:hypothetical protein
MAAGSMVNPAVDPNLEDELFAREVDEVKRWWTEPRWRHTKRPFTAEQIVNKRGNLKIEYPSNAQSKKLWNILEKRFQVCTESASMSPEAMANAPRTDQRCQLHVRLLGAHGRYPDGQVPRHRLRLGLAVVVDRVGVRRARPGSRRLPLRESSSISGRTKS